MTRALRPENLCNAIEEVVKGCVKVVTLDEISLLPKTFDDGRVIRNNLRNGGFPDTTHTDKGDVRFSKNSLDHILDEIVPPEE